MPFVGGGLFRRLYNFVMDRDNGIGISASRMDSSLDDLAAAFGNSLTRDGQSPPEADLPMGGFKFTNVDDASDSGDYVSAGDVQNSVGVWGGAAGGTPNALTVTTGTPNTALTDGREALFIAASNNTGAATLNVDAAGVKSLRIMGLSKKITDLRADELVAGRVYRAVYTDGEFVISQPSSVSHYLQGWTLATSQFLPNRPATSAGEVVLSTYGGGSSRIFRTVDGATFSQTHANNENESVNAAIDGSGDFFYAAGSGSFGTTRVYKSTTGGASWSEIDDFSTFARIGYAIGGGNHVLVASGPTGSQNAISYYSSDGTDPSSVAVSTGKYAPYDNSSYFGDSLHVIGLNDGKVYTSSDGSSWSAAGFSGVSDAFAAFHHDGSDWWGVTGDGELWTSDDDWATATEVTNLPGTPSSLRAVAVLTGDGNTSICVGGTNGYFAFSTDGGSNWTQPSVPLSTVFGITELDGRAIISGLGGAAYSDF